MVDTSCTSLDHITTSTCFLEPATSSGHLGPFHLGDESEFRPLNARFTHHCQLFPGFHCHIIICGSFTAFLSHSKSPIGSSCLFLCLHSRVQVYLRPYSKLRAYPEFLSPSYHEPTPNLRIVSLMFSNPTTRPQLFLPSRHAIIDKKVNRNNKTAGTDTRGPIQQLSSNANFGPSPTTHTIYTSITSTCTISTFL